MSATLIASRLEVLGEPAAPRSLSVKVSAKIY